MDRRKPWNPFPLASLSVRKTAPRISPCAADILRYLATRSNYLGQTVVGHRRICDDTGRSKDYVTKGLRELEILGLLTTTRRGRKGEKADQRVISKSILSPEYQDLKAGSSPEEQDYNENSSPEQQEYESICSPDFKVSSPAMQGETLQNEPYRKTIEPNLTEQNQNPNQSTNQSIDERATPCFSSYEKHNPPTDGFSFLADGFIPSLPEYEKLHDNMDEALLIKMKRSWLGEQWTECFQRFKPSMEDLQLFYETLKACEEQCCYPKELIEYREKHGPKKLIGGLRSPRGLHKAVVGGDRFNGLVAQYKACGLDPSSCPTCKPNGKKQGKPYQQAARAEHW
jgi:hypothetical protein